MRVGVVHVNTEEASGPYTELITGNLERAKRPDTELVHTYVKHLRRATDTALAYPTLLNKVDAVAETVALEAQGADAVLVACSGDTGVAEARSLVSIPVVGPMEAAMLLACSYGFRFGIVTVHDPTWASWLEQAVFSAGLAGRYVGMRQLKTPTAVVFTEGFERPELVRDDILDRTREIVQAGADAVLIGSAGLSTFATHFEISRLETPEVPIFDVISVGLKLAELRADLKAQLGIPAVSRAGWHAEFSQDDRRRVNRLFGWTPEPAETRARA